MLIMSYAQTELGIMKYFLYFLFVTLQLKKSLAESNANSESGSGSGFGVESSSGSGSNPSGDGIMTSKYLLETRVDDLLLLLRSRCQPVIVLPIGEYLPFQELGSTPGVNKQCLKRRLDGASPAINIPIGFPIGYSIQSKAYVSWSGAVK